MTRRVVLPCLAVVCMVISILMSTSLHTAEASELEKWLIMPGPVVLSHAETESACENCHDPLSDKPQFELCVGCHTAVGDDLKGKHGFHGRLPEAQQSECADCHTDHEGRDMTIVNLDETTFDHWLTDFALGGEHVSVACDDCHVRGKKHSDAATACIDCHRADDPHGGLLGQECGSCHNASDWFATDFNHNATTFPLTGMHAGVSCTACHVSSTFSDFRDRGGSDCVSCHRENDVHETRNGSDCASCHVVSSWRSVDFVHEKRTDVALPPGHETLACVACHTGDIHDELPRSCSGCHADQDPHKGQLGLQCNSCHLASDWTAKIWFDHDLMSFPLMGAHAAVACDQCHASAAFHDAATDCVDCHANDDPHESAFGRQCDDCHNPSAWSSSQFDHDTQSSFALNGAHDEAACGDCHETPRQEGSPVSADCYSCHRREDPHFGRFGKRCDSCHNTSSFSRIEGM